ncbi:MAG: hypothetical protein Tsb0034_05000 [Ekhidna sp.]
MKEVDPSIFKEIESFLDKLPKNNSNEFTISSDYELNKELILACEDILASSDDYNSINSLKIAIAIYFLPNAYLPSQLVNKPSIDLITDYLRKTEISNASQKEIVELVSGFGRNENLSLTQKVLHDAYHSIKSQKGFLDNAMAIKKDIGKNGEKYNEIEWMNLLDSDLRHVSFNTPYASEQYQKRIEKNRDQLSKQRKKLEKKMDLALQKELDVDEEDLKRLKKKLSKIEDRPERGVETLFRLASRNHFTLNTQVDRKSGILISINSIILSIILSVVLPQIETDPHLIIPVIMILITNIVSIVYAILSTRPDKTHGAISTKNKDNLLFYGNFQHLSEEDYVREINDIMNSSQDLYDEISRDIYHLGKNLQRKFGLLRKSFNYFMYGIIASVAVFLICHLFFGNLL